MIAHNPTRRGSSPTLRDLISQGRRCDRVQPEQRRRAEPGCCSAKAAGIKDVAVDAYVTDPDAWNFYNNQVDYAYLGASWLFKYLEDNGHANGTIWYNARHRRPPGRHRSP